MKCQLTTGNSKGFVEELKRLKTEGKVAEILYDDQGLDRAGGLIESIDSNTLVFENGQQVAISTIVALNGTFLDNYSGC